MITYDGVNLLDFGVHVSAEGTYNAPARSITEEVIPGRNGTLIIDNGRYENRVVTYPAYILKRLEANMTALRAFLFSHTSYARLEDSFHPHEFYMAMPVDGVEVQTSGRYNREGQFTLTFNCKPQRWLKSGEETMVLTDAGAVYNPTEFTAKPLLRVYGSGVVHIGDVTLTIDTEAEFVDIDCEIEDCYSNGTNQNPFVTVDDFPTFPPGQTSITFEEGITRIDVMPRWWTL